MKTIHKIRIVEGYLSDDQLSDRQMAVLDGGDVCIIHEVCLDQENDKCTSFYEGKVCSDGMDPDKMYCDTKF